MRPKGPGLLIILFCAGRELQGREGDLPRRGGYPEVVEGEQGQVPQPRQTGQVRSILLSYWLRLVGPSTNEEALLLEYEHVLTLLSGRKYLCAPATSTQAERVFSALGWLMNKRRQNLTGAHVNSQLFLKENLEW